MTNYVVLVGRLFEEIEGNEIKLAVNRSTKNEEGIYEVDVIPVMVLGQLQSNMKEYCRKGDVIGIRGRIEVVEDKIVVIAEKVTFLSSKKNEE